MEITAKFIGKNNSLGYVHGEVYELKITGSLIRRKDGTGKCMYDSVAAFFRN